MPNAAVHGLAIGCWLVLVGSVTLAQRPADPLTTPQLLVQLARDTGLNQRGQQTPADVQHIRTLLKAAIRLDPTLVEAYVWLCELATLEGDDAEAGRMLTGLVNADPTHQGAFARWLQAGLRSRQTMEERAAWLDAVADAHRPPVQRAMIHVAQAHLAIERLHLASARQHVARAQELDPASLDAATLAFDLLEDDADAPTRLRAILRILELSPSSLQPAWQAGSILDEYGLVAEAARFYDHALDVARQANPDAALPAAFHLTLARNAHARGMVEAAVEHTRTAIRDPSVASEAGIFLHYLRQRYLPDAATTVRDQLRRRFAAIRDPADFPVNELAQAAWFYCTIDSQPDRALMLAKTVAERAPHDRFVQRVLGWAQAVNHQDEAAARTLRPLARRDPYAAYMLAKLARDAGDEAAAEQIVQALDPPPIAGPAFDLLSELTAPAATTQPAPEAVVANPENASTATQPATQPASPPTTRPSRPPPQERYPGIVRALSAFDQRVLAFHREPARFLEARAELEDPSLSIGQPWRAVFTITNRGPFPIPLGPDAMVNPVFLLSFTVEGDRRRDYPALTTISLDHVRVLYPGQTASVRQTLDVGPLRRVARQTPQQLQRVTLRAILDPLQLPDGRWQPAPGGQVLRPVYFNRLPARTGREATNALFSALAGSSPRDQVRALEAMAQLVGERQRADWKRLEYEPAPIPIERMQAALLSLLGSQSWELRARALDALQVMGIDQQFYAAVQANLEHPHWLVRLMALRLLARQGSPFADRARAIAEDDPDELVRELAASYLAKWRP